MRRRRWRRYGVGREEGNAREIWVTCAAVKERKRKNEGQRESLKIHSPPLQWSRASLFSVRESESEGWALVCVRVCVCLCVRSVCVRYREINWSLTLIARPAQLYSKGGVALFAL